jgi:hypothetical protein
MVVFAPFETYEHPKDLEMAAGDVFPNSLLFPKARLQDLLLGSNIYASSGVPELGPK